MDFLTGPSFQEGRGSGVCAVALPRQPAATSASIASRMRMRARVIAGIVLPAAGNTSGGILFPMNQMSKASPREYEKLAAWLSVRLFSVRIPIGVFVIGSSTGSFLGKWLLGGEGKHGFRMNRQIAA